jgi:hypothetical protein
MRDPNELLTGDEYARERKCSLRTVERERTTGTGCTFIKIGRSVRYRWGDVLAFLQLHARQSTSEPEPPTEAGAAGRGSGSGVCEAHLPVLVPT